MNISISFLLLGQFLSQSPTFPTTYSSTFGSYFFRLKQSTFSHSLSPVFFAKNSLINFRADTSTFQYFLTSALVFEKNDIRDATIDSRRISLIVGPISLSFCRFRLCVGRENVLGGAIFCLTNLSLTQCLFEHNRATKAGSVYCTGGLNISSVTFDGGYSETGQGFVNEKCSNCNLIVFLSTFVNLESNDYSCFVRSSPGNVTIHSVNYSTNSAKNKNAGSFISDARVIVSVSILFEMVAFSDTSLVFNRCQNSRIELTLFWLLKASDNSNEGSTCISYYDTLSILTVHHCAFILCSNGGSQLVRASGDAQIMFSELCCTSSQEKFSGSDGKGIHIDKKARFDDSCQDRLVIHVDKPFGYHTENAALELATMRSDVYNGLVIGALVITEMLLAAGLTFLLLYQIVRC